MSKRIFFYTRSLHNGGVDRVVFNLAEEFVARGYDVAIVVDHDNRYSPFRDLLPAGVRYLVLDAAGPVARLLKLRRLIRRERPDAVMCASFGFPNIFAVLVRLIAGVDFHLMLTEHCFPSVDRAAPKPWQSRYWFFPIAHFAYPHADSIVAVSQGTGDDLARVINIDRGRVQCIYNPLVSQALLDQSRCPAGHRWFDDAATPVVIAVGRLEAQKNFALLIRAFARVAALRECRLLILGDGSERDRLAALVASLGLADRVEMPGFAPNPHAHVARAAVLVLSSDFESLANVVIEAMAVGTPVIATNCPSGPSEALGDGRYGRLVPVGDEAGLAAAIGDALDERAPPVPADWLEQFSTRRVADRYLEVMC